MSHQFPPWFSGGEVLTRRISVPKPPHRSRLAQWNVGRVRLVSNLGGAEAERSASRLGLNGRGAGREQHRCAGGRGGGCPFLNRRGMNEVFTGGLGS
jgi:hypothetical protein